jgi:hypothetical protein
VHLTHDGKGIIITNYRVRTNKKHSSLTVALTGFQEGRFSPEFPANLCKEERICIH